MLCSVLTWLDIYELEMSVCSNNVVEVLLLNRCYKKWVHHQNLINFVHCKLRFQFFYYQISERIEKNAGFFTWQPIILSIWQKMRPDMNVFDRCTFISLIGAPFHRFTVNFFSTPINLTLQFRRSHWMFCWNANSHRHSKIEFVLVTSEFLAPQRAESWQKLRFNLFSTCVFFRQSFDLINELDILFGSCE